MQRAKQPFERAFIKSAANIPIPEAASDAVLMEHGLEKTGAYDKWLSKQ